MEKNQLLVIIVTYNSEKYIRECLNPFKDKPCNWEIMVIDNKSTDNTIDIIKQEYGDIILVQNEENLGFGSANNIGLRYAIKNEFNHTLLLNADAYISIKDVKELIKLQKNNPEYYVLSPIHYDASLEHIDKGFIEYVKTSNSLIEDLIIQQNIKDIYEVDFVNAAIWLLNKQSLVNIGGFSPTFFHYDEDYNYINRIHYHNKFCGITPLARGVHNRSNRPANPIYDGFYKVKYRMIVRDLSNPNLKFKKTLRNFIKVNIFNLYKINELEIVIKLLKNLNNIYKNLVVSKERGNSFLMKNAKTHTAPERE